VAFKEPQIPYEIFWIWRAWMRLNECRNWHTGMGPSTPATISFSAIIEWAEFYGYDEEDFEMLDACIREMDQVYIRHMVEKAKQDAK
jgi:hypothetical protein